VRGTRFRLTSIRLPIAEADAEIFMIRRRSIGLGTFVACVAACAPPKAAEVPTFGAGQGEAIFNQYQLTGDVGPLGGGKWKRSDGEYQWRQLEEVARQFPESADVYDRANTRNLVLNTAAAAGGSIIGYTFGWNAFASDGERWSTGTQEAAYGAGVGIILATLFAATTWHNPAEELADVYNRALRKQLGLPDSPPTRNKDTPAWVPRTYTAHGIGWTF